LGTVSCAVLITLEEIVLGLFYANVFEFTCGKKIGRAHV